MSGCVRQAPKASVGGATSPTEPRWRTRLRPVLLGLLLSLGAPHPDQHDDARKRGPHPGDQPSAEVVPGPLLPGGPGRSVTLDPDALQTRTACQHISSPQGSRGASETLQPPPSRHRRGAQGASPGHGHALCCRVTPGPLPVSSAFKKETRRAKSGPAAQRPGTGFRPGGGLSPFPAHPCRARPRPSPHSRPHPPVPFHDPAVE